MAECVGCGAYESHESQSDTTYSNGNRVIVDAAIISDRSGECERVLNPETGVDDCKPVHVAGVDDCHSEVNQQVTIIAGATAQARYNFDMGNWVYVPIGSTVVVWMTANAKNCGQAVSKDLYIQGQNPNGSWGTLINLHILAGCFECQWFL